MGRQWRTGSGSPDYSVRAVRRVCDVFDLLQRETQGVTVAVAAQLLGMSRSSLLRYLMTLERRRYVECDPATGKYRLGAAFLPVQALHVDVLLQRARRHLEELRELLKETVSLGLLEGTNVLCLDVSESENSLRVTREPGEREPLHASALGKAIGAELGDGRVTDLLEDAGMRQFTARTITDPDAYLAELAEVRKRGYATEEGEYRADICTVAVALPGDRFIAGLSVSLPAERFTPYRADNIADVLEAHMRQLSRLETE